MSENKRFFRNLFENLHGSGAGRIGAIIAFVIALLLVIFGIWKTLFILLMTLAGFFIGARYFTQKETLRNLLDKLFPPGKFR